MEKEETPFLPDDWSGLGNPYDSRTAVITQGFLERLLFWIFPPLIRLLVYWCYEKAKPVRKFCKNRISYRTC